MEEHKKRNKNVELRSEKVRNVVGQVPPILLRWGISIIGIVLLFLFVVSYYLPYKQVYSGEALVRAIPKTENDNIHLSIFLRFNERRPDKKTINGSDILLNSTSQDKVVMGKIISLSSDRDTLGRSEAKIIVHRLSIKHLEYSEVDFTLTHTSGSILEHFINKAK